jgi:hypothetical protein
LKNPAHDDVDATLEGTSHVRNSIRGERRGKGVSTRRAYRE